MHARDLARPTALLVAIIISASPAVAQMPGLPVLQNAFVAPGLVAAVNAGNGSGAAYGAAASWAPGSGRFQVSGSLGSYAPTGGGSSLAYGARLATSLFSMGGGNLGIGGFIGVGGAGATKGGARPPAQIPLGASIGFRHAMGSRGVSFYGTPMLLFTSAPAGGKSSSAFRVGLGGDISLTSSLGLTAGVELGSAMAASTGGPTGTRFGGALSWAFGR